MQTPKTKAEWENLANWYASAKYPTGESWNPHLWSLVPNGFIVKNEQGKKDEKFVFDFKSNRVQVTKFKKQPGSHIPIEQKPNWYKIPKELHMMAFVDPEIKYPELNKKKPKDKQFYVELVVDGYIDQEDDYETDEYDPEYDYDDDYDNDNSYQKCEIYTLWAPNRKTVDNWSDNKDFKDKEGNEGWIGGVISKEELTPIKIKEVIK